MSRQRSADRGRDDSEVVVDRTQLDRLHDDLYVLECAVEDTLRDLAEADVDVREGRRATEWLRDACHPLVDRQLTPN